MPRVYVIQNQHRLDRERQELLPVFDFSHAEEYGDIDFLLSPTVRPFDSGKAIALLREALQHFRQDDYLLLVGNPCLIGWATAIAAQRTGGKVRLLQWNGRQERYIAIESDLGD